MKAAPLALIVAAACLSVAGDVSLKRFGDARGGKDLAACLVLWNTSSLLWVLAYLWRLPLGRTTAIGFFLVLFLNCAAGVALYGESYTRAQAAGLVLGVLGLVLLVIE